MKNFVLRPLEDLSEIAKNVVYGDHITSHAVSNRDEVTMITKARLTCK